MDFSSDDEFWNQIETRPNLKGPGKFKTSDFFQIVSCEGFLVKGKRFETVINNIRLAKEVELTTQTMLVRKKTMKEVENNVEIVRSKYEDDVAEILRQNHKLKSECFTLRHKLKRASEMLKAQEYLLTISRILDHQEVTLHEKTDEKQDDGKIFQSQIKLLRDVCNLYMKDLEQSRSLVLELENKIKIMQEFHENEIQKLHIQMKSKEKELLDQIFDVKEKFEKFKDDVKNEIELGEVIQKKLVDSNFKLKDELKNAQNILQTPRLRQKTFERFKSVGAEKSGLEKSFVEENEKKKGSLLSLPLISSEKEGFSTHFDTPRGSSRFLCIQSSKKFVI
jgi:hypothetical protein